MHTVGPSHDTARSAQHDPTNEWPDSPLHQTADDRWSFQAHRGLNNAMRSLFGGWMLAALTEAAERNGGYLRELSVGFVGGVVRDEIVELRVRPLTDRGAFRHVQLRATVGNRIAVSGRALIGPEPDVGGSPPAPPAALGPLDWEERPFGSGPGTGSSRLLEVRPILPDDDVIRLGRSLQWVRVKAATSGSLAVAVVSDFVPTLVSRARADYPVVLTMSSSLTITSRPSPGWLLVEAEIVSADALVATGGVKIWGENGQLVATATQACRLLPRPADRRAGSKASP
jgi:acyl-CoA thioesterase